MARTNGEGVLRHGIATCVTVRVHPDHVGDFITETLINRGESLREPGNLAFEVLQDEDDDTAFVLLYEAYESKEGAEIHKTTPHYLQWRARVESWMAVPRERRRFWVLGDK